MNTDDLLGGDQDGADLSGADRISLFYALSRDKQEEYLRNLGKRSKKIVLAENNSRYEVESKYHLLPDQIQDGLKKKRLQFADTRFYVVKDIAGKTSIDMFQGTDNKNPGLGNVANQKLEKDNWFLLSAIRMLYAFDLNGRDVATFGEIPTYIKNGELELESGQKKLIGLTSNEVFETTQVYLKQLGTYKLHSTKLIEPQVEIKMPVKFTIAAPANSFLKVVFIGQSVIPF